MGQVLCYYSSIRKYSECEFVAWDFIEYMTDVYEEGSFIFNTVSLVIMTILFMISMFVKYVDFTASYVTTVLIPMILGAFCSWVISIRQYWWMPGFLLNFADKVSAITGLTMDIHLPLGTLIFLFMNLVTACNRKQHGRGFTWSPFVISLVLAAATSIFFFFKRYYYVESFIFWYTFLIYCLYGACLILILIIPFVACCCSGAKPGQSSSPVVANAKSRMLWSIMFSIFVLLPSFATKFFNDYIAYGYERSNQNGENNFSVARGMYSIYVFILMIHPLIICFAALIFLPAHRSVFCCSQGYARGGKIASSNIKKIEPVQPIYAPNQSPTAIPTAPTQNSPMQPIYVPNQATTIPTAPTQPVQGYEDQNLIAYLNNPSIAPPLPNQRIQSVPAVTPCPNCAHVAAYNCHVGHMQQPLLIQKIPQDMTNVIQMPHQQVAYQNFAASSVPQQAFVAQPTTLVRFASQPNLVQFNGMQPGISMPHMAAAQNPFYIQS